MKLYLGEKQALIVQNFQSLFKVAQVALGGGEPEPNKLPPGTKVVELKSAAELQAACWEVFG